MTYKIVTYFNDKEFAVLRYGLTKERADEVAEKDNKYYSDRKMKIFVKVEEEK